MKEYKYTIDGKEYKVAIGDIEENVAHVTVNGEEFKVEMEPEAEPEKKKVVLGQPVESTDETATPAATAGHDHFHQRGRWRRGECRRHRGGA